MFEENIEHYLNLRIEDRSKNACIIPTHLFSEIVNCLTEAGLKMSEALEEVPTDNKYYISTLQVELIKNIIEELYLNIDNLTSYEWMTLHNMLTYVSNYNNGKIYRRSTLLEGLTKHSSKLPEDFVGYVELLIESASCFVTGNEPILSTSTEAMSQYIKKFVRPITYNSRGKEMKDVLDEILLDVEPERIEMTTDFVEKSVKRSTSYELGITQKAYKELVKIVEDQDLVLHTDDIGDLIALNTSGRVNSLVTALKVGTTKLKFLMEKTTKDKEQGDKVTSNKRVSIYTETADTRGSVLGKVYNKNNKVSDNDIINLVNKCKETLKNNPEAVDAAVRVTSIALILMPGGRAAKTSAKLVRELIRALDTLDLTTAGKSPEVRALSAHIRNTAQETKAVKTS